MRAHARSAGRWLFSALCVLTLALTAGARAAEPGPQDLDAVIRQMLAVGEAKESTPLFRAFRASKVPHKEKLRKLDAAMKTARPTQEGKLAYLNIAASHGNKAEFIGSTALDLLRGGDARTAGRAARLLKRYLSGGWKLKNAEEVKAALWGRVEKGNMEQLDRAFLCLLMLDKGKVKAALMEGLKGRKWPEKERGRLVELTRWNFPKEEVVALIKAELRVAGYRYRIDLQGHLRRLLGQKEADKLADAIEKAKYKGLTQAQLRDAKVSCEFVDCPLDMVLDHFRKRFGMDIRLDARRGQCDPKSPTSGNFRDCPTFQALARLTAQAGAAPRFKGTHFEVVKGAIPDTTTAEQKRKISAALDKKINIEFRGTPLSEALYFLRRVSGVSLNVDRKVRREMGRKPFKRSYKKTPVRQVLQDILTQAGLKQRYMHGAIQLYK